MALGILPNNHIRLILKPGIDIIPLNGAHHQHPLLIFVFLQSEISQYLSVVVEDSVRAPFTGFCVNSIKKDTPPLKMLLRHLHVTLPGPSHQHHLEFGRPSLQHFVAVRSKVQVLVAGVVEEGQFGDQAEDALKMQD